MAYQSAEQFREAAAKRRKTKDIEVEGVGTVRLRALSAGDAQRFQADVKKYATDGRDAEELAFPLIARSWIGENGELWLPEHEGVVLARSLDPLTYNAIAQAVLELNGLTATAVEEAESFSEAGRQKESSPTDSLQTSATPTSI